MFDKKITRKEFLKMAGFFVMAGFILPFLKKLSAFRFNEPRKEAKYYKKLAG